MSDNVNTLYSRARFTQIRKWFLSKSKNSSMGNDFQRLLKEFRINAALFLICFKRLY